MNPWRLWRHAILFAEAVVTCALVWFALCAGSARAAGVVGDGSPASCTAEALASAMAGGGAVTFSCGPEPVTITLAAGPLTITLDTLMDGGGKVTIGGGHTARLFYVAPGATFTVANAGLADAYSADGCGAAVHADGVLALDHASVRDSTADGPEGCGVITAASRLSIRNSEIVSNTVVLSGTIFLSSTARAEIAGTSVNRNLAGYGGAVYVDEGAELTVTESSLLSNGANYNGGALYNRSRATIRNSTLSGNAAWYNGGAIASFGVLMLDHTTVSWSNTVGGYGGGIFAYGGTTIASSLLESNQCGIYGGSIWSSGQLTITESHIARSFGGHGGGAFIADGTAVLQNTTLYYNASWSGGGLYLDDGTGKLINVTVSMNFARVMGGGIDNSGTLTIVNSTVSRNSAGSGGGISGIPVDRIQNTIVADNPGGNCTAGITSEAYNLSDDATCAFVSSGSLISVSARLAMPADNGGPRVGAGAGAPMMTLMPLPGSPVVDVIRGTAGVNYPAADQRGVARPIGTLADMGALEAGPFYRIYLAPILQ